MQFPELGVRAFNVLIGVQKVQEGSAGVVSFIEDLVHELDDVAPRVNPIDVLQVVVLSPRYEPPLVHLVENQPVVSTQNALELGFVAPHGVCVVHGASEIESERVEKRVVFWEGVQSKHSWTCAFITPQNELDSSKPHKTFGYFDTIFRLYLSTSQNLYGPHVSMFQEKFCPNIPEVYANRPVSKYW